MCGIVAVISSPLSQLELGTIERMTDAVAHRGPDGRGVCYLHRSAERWHASSDERPGWLVALGHRRLSILDLSDAGRQPMAYEDHLHLTYNGEVYNYVELRRELEAAGFAFRTRTDTEVVLAAYSRWGAACFERMKGMWGAVLIDTRAQVAVLSRDRLGIKPLYTWRGDGLFAAFSEPKQRRLLPGAVSVDHNTLHAYLSAGYEPPGSSFFRDVCPVDPGTTQVVDLSRLHVVDTLRYWSPSRVDERKWNPADAGAAFRDSFEQSVRLHLRSDVPVGCALSGGMDSSAVAAVASRLLQPERLNTFSVTFPGDRIDERPYMDAIIERTNASPHFTTPTAAGFLEDLSRFLHIHDEPVGSLSQYAGYCVARLTRERSVPVTLNGQGGDEIFSAYWQCYFVHLLALARSGHARSLLSEVGGSLTPSGNSEVWRQAPSMAGRFLRKRRSVARGVLRGPSDDVQVQAPVQAAVQLSDRERRVYDITNLTLPRLLKWDDRNFMAFGVEGRYPFLDHELIELCLSFPRDVLYRRGFTKEPLRQGLAAVLPPLVARRRTKLGFETPQGAWLGGELAATVDAALANDSPLWAFVHDRDTRALARRAASNRATHEEQQLLFRVYLAHRWLVEGQVQC